MDKCKNYKKIKLHYSIIVSMNKSLLGLMLLIHNAEPRSQQLLAGGLVYCNCIGKDVSIECKVTPGLPRVT